VVSEELYKACEQHTCGEKSNTYDDTLCKNRSIFPDSLEESQHRYSAAAIHQEETFYTFAQCFISLLCEIRWF